MHFFANSIKFGISVKNGAERVDYQTKIMFQTRERPRCVFPDFLQYFFVVVYWKVESAKLSKQHGADASGAAGVPPVGVHSVDVRVQTIKQVVVA